MSAVSPCRSMAKDWAELVLLDYYLCWPARDSQRWAGVRLPSRHDILDDYSQIFLKSQDVCCSLSVNKPEYVLTSLIVFKHSW